MYSANNWIQMKEYASLFLAITFTVRFCYVINSQEDSASFGEILFCCLLSWNCLVPSIAKSKEPNLRDALKLDKSIQHETLVVGNSFYQCSSNYLQGRVTSNCSFRKQWIAPDGFFFFLT